MTTLNKMFPILDTFNHSTFLKHFRLWIGYGDIYQIPEDFHRLSFKSKNFFKLDPNNEYFLHNLSDFQTAVHIRHLANINILPDLTLTYKCMNDSQFYFDTFHITNVPIIPKFSSLEPYSFFKSLFNYHFNYHLGLSLACIVFIITIILTLLYTLNFITSLSYKDNEKLSPYECGFEPIHTNARIKFDVLYWIIGILYLIFDLEIIFIFPLATILHSLQNPIALLVYLIFIIILTLGFVYEWKKGALKLNLPQSI